MRIKHIFLQNFCKFYGYNTLDTDIYDRTEISGANETGKSTIKRAIQHIFGCRDENGKEISGIRPHDKDGNDIDGDITEMVTVEVDGEEKVLKKVCRKNYNKKGEFTGNVTDYYINDIPKKQADFDSFLEECACDKNRFSLCINAMTLLLKGGTEQRAILADMFGQHSNDDICNQFPEFEELRAILQDGTVDELKKRCNTQLYGTRGRNGTKGLQDLLDEIPSRIDEVSRQRVDIDLADLELKKKALLDKLSENIKQQTDTQNSMISYDKLSDGIIELKGQLSALQQKANEKLDADRREKRTTLNQIQNEHQKELLKADTIREEVTALEKRIEQYEQKRQDLKKSWDLNKSLKFDENSLICSYCGQEYPEEKKEQLRTEFDTHKAHELELITKEGSSCAEHIKADQAELEHKREELKKTEDEVERLEKEIAIADNALNSIPASVDISNTEEYKAVQSQIAEKEASMNKFTDMNLLRFQLKCDEEQIRKDISVVDKSLASVTINESVDKRITELEQERRDIAQKITDVQAQLDLLKKFSRKKNELLEAEVNEYLEFCHVKMFRPLVNGDTEECCDFIYKGEPYSRNMNHGAKILTEIDICRAFQKKCGVELPIMTDDTESLDSWRIPQIDSQLIMFRRSDDKELKVREM